MRDGQEFMCPGHDTNNL